MALWGQRFRSIKEGIKKSEFKTVLTNHPSGTLTTVLSQVLPANPKQIRDSRDAAKKEKFSSHSRFHYPPSKPSQYENPSFPVGVFQVQRRSPIMLGAFLNR